MYAQTLPFPRHIVHNSPINQQQNVVFLPKSELGLFNYGKRVSKSSGTSRRRFHSAMIRCGDSQEKQKLKHEEKFDDGYYIRRCVEIARKAIGCTSPNPMVGCVLVKDGKIVGEGFHPKAGQPHAEVFALRDAGDLAENATAYVSLEPCNHYGRTPPCTEALIEAKVKHVVIGMVDPNPIVASTGVKKLQDAGIGVTVGVEEELCKRLNEAYIHRMMTGKPFVTLRYSMSLDGDILNQLGEEAMEYGGYYSKLLQEYDTLVLSSAALADKSSLPKSKEPGANQPLTIVLSKHPNLTLHSIDTTSKLTVISENGTSLEPETSPEGIEMLSFNRISLLKILDHCHRQGLCNILLNLTGNSVDFEEIVKEGFEQNLFQKVVVEVLPVLGGDEERVLKNVDLKIKEKVKKLTPYVCGQSVILEGYF